MKQLMAGGGVALIGGTLVPLLSKLTKTDKLSSVGLSMLRQDLFASDLYESVLTEKFETPFISEYCQQIIRV